MLWYLLRTWAGGEEALVKEIRRTVPPYMYDEAFVIYNERIWRRQGQSIIQTEPLFKGCVFLTCRETEALFRRLERIPAMSRLIASGYLSMFPLMEQDARFLESLSGPEHILRTSFVLRERDDGDTYRIYGPLEHLLDGIERIKFRSRTVKTRKRLWGEDSVIALGIITGEDRTVQRRGTEMAVEWPFEGHYSLLEIDKDADGKNVYRHRESVTLLAGGKISAAHGSAGTAGREAANVAERAVAGQERERAAAG